MGIKMLFRLVLPCQVIKNISSASPAVSMQSYSSPTSPIVSKPSRFNPPTSPAKSQQSDTNISTEISLPNSDVRNFGWFNRGLVSWALEGIIVASLKRAWEFEAVQRLFTVVHRRKSVLSRLLFANEFWGNSCSRPEVVKSLVVCVSVVVRATMNVFLDSFELFGSKLL